MNYTFEQGEKSTVKINITLNAEEWSAAQVDAYNKTKGKYSVPGFRKGHVPMNVIEQNYGKGIFFEEAINYSFGKYYYDILEKEKSIEPIDRPEVEIEKIDGEGLKLVAVVPVKPEVKLGEYKGINIEKVEYNVKDEDVEVEINRLKEQKAKEVSVDGRAAQNGDVTVIDYSGKVNGVLFNGGTAEKQNLTLGSGAFIPGFEEQVVGMNIGDTKDITVKFPDDYGSEELKGKEAVFTVTLHELKVKEYPELTDEFIKEVTGEENLEAYKVKTREKIQKNNNDKAEREIEDKLIKVIADASEVEIPQILIEKQIDNMVQEMEYRMMYQGLKLEDYLKYSKQTMEDYRKGFAVQAKEQVKSQLVIDKILSEEKIEATQEEIDAKIAEQAASVNKEVEEYKKTMNEKHESYIENGIVVDKLFKFLKANNNIK